MNVLRMGLLVEQGPLWLLVESRLQGRGGNRETSSEVIVVTALRGGRGRGQGAAVGQWARLG